MMHTRYYTISIYERYQVFFNSMKLNYNFLDYFNVSIIFLHYMKLFETVHKTIIIIKVRFHFVSEQTISQNLIL